MVLSVAAASRVLLVDGDLGMLMMGRTRALTDLALGMVDATHALREDVGRYAGTGR